ncbi:MAG TPA: BON domain-containing protein, partial [Candidatus Eisenbacteria bacterium]|nr:BON domain-containing protein [Candidatus Eisenbacteria bacterium]
LADGPWLLSLPDGTDLPLDSPVLKAIEGRARVAAMLEAFCEEQGSVPAAVRPLVIFPDGYDLTTVNDPDVATATPQPRAINARALADELLRPIGAERLDAGLYREWIYSRVLNRQDEDSVALTWLDPSGDSITQRLQSFGDRKDRKEEDRWRMPPPEMPRVAREPARPPLSRKAGGTIAKLAGISVVLALSLFVARAFYDAETRSKDAVPPWAGNEGAPPASQPPPGPLSEALPERTPSPYDGIAGGLKSAPAPKNGDGTGPSSDTARPTGNTGQDSKPTAGATSAPETIERQIDRAIQARAVDGVVVAFVEETAYLSGAVLSEKQKAAAEQAARNVPGVKRVESSIQVKWEPG